jgi:tRNA threonylcarbamoyladenosine biosynthesis protein TsaB
MAKILLIETATKVCSVGISNNGELSNLKEIHEENYSHSEKLHVLIQELMDDSKTEFKELAAVCVSKGPGSFTGLRIGVSAAKGFCFSLGIPLLSVDTTLAMAAQYYELYPSSTSLFAPMIDARRMEVYNAIYNPKLECIKTLSADILDENSYSSFDQEICFAGDGMPKWKEICKNSNASFIELFPSVKGMAKIAQQKFESDSFEDLAYFEPFYLKDFVAGKKKA